MIRLVKAHRAQEVCDRYLTQGTVETLVVFGGCAQALSQGAKVSSTPPDELKVTVKGEEAAVQDPAAADPQLAVYDGGHWRFASATWRRGRGPRTCRCRRRSCAHGRRGSARRGSG